MREIKRYVRYYIEKRNSWSDQSKQRPRNVLLMFNYNGKRLHTLTGVKVAECDWSSDKQRVKLNVKRANEVNSYLDLLEQKINDIYYGALAKGIILNNNLILKEMNKDKQTERALLLGEWKKYLDIQKLKIKKGSHEALTHSFEHFERFAKGKHLEFDDINAELLSKYAAYLFGLKHADNTVHKHIKRLRAFMTYAKKAGLHTNERYRDFNVSEKVGRIFFLDWEDIKKLMQYHPQDEIESKVLSNFLFACFSGMRFSDYHSLKRSEVTKMNFTGVKKDYWSATILQVKTNKVTKVPMLPEALEIIEKNKDVEAEYALPRVNLQQINEHIKKIAEKAGIKSLCPEDTHRNGKRETKYYEKWEMICSHTARKTFISLAATKGIPINVVADIVGQNPKTTMKHYMGVLDKDKFDILLKQMQFKNFDGEDSKE